ncbi:MAG: ZIP family metal transporter [Armatimonadetes bacterium]|nr:ZIP family metal transporter [Armatimonadota bacterium]
MLIQLIAYSTTAGLATLAGAIAVLARGPLRRKTVARMMGFGSGVLTGAAFLHLIPSSVERSPIIAGAGMVISFLIFIAIEHVVVIRAHPHPAHHPIGRVEAIGIVGFIALTVHSLVDGLAIAAGFRVSHELGLTAAIAVIAHEVPEGVTSVSVFTAANYARKLTLMLSSIVALATPGAALISWFWTRGITQEALAFLLAFAAGSFIYVPAADILPRLHEERDIPSFIYLLLGVAIPVVLLFLE